jgi:hypothetical protein
MNIVANGEGLVLLLNATKHGPNDVANFWSPTKFDFPPKPNCTRWHFDCFGRARLVKGALCVFCRITILG